MLFLTNSTHSFTRPQEDQKWNLTYKNAEKRMQTTFVPRKNKVNKYVLLASGGEGTRTRLYETKHKIWS